MFSVCSIFMTFNNQIQKEKYNEHKQYIHNYNS